MRKRPAYQKRDNSLVEEIFSDGYQASAWDFLKIAAWKSARNLALISLNPKEKVNQSFKSLIELLGTFPYEDTVKEFDSIDWSNWGKEVENLYSKTGISKLDGIQFTAFTGLLGYLRPAIFPVIDIYTAEGIFGGQVARNRNRWANSGAYTTFTRHLAGPSTSKLPDWLKKIPDIDKDKAKWSELNIHERDLIIFNSVRGAKKLSWSKFDGLSIAHLT